METRSMSAVQLIEHIVSTHHAFLKKALPAGTALLAQARREAGQPRLLDELVQVHEALRAELEQHLMKEERILFPMIGQLAAGETPTFGCGHVDGPIQQMEIEHQSAREALATIQSLRAGGLPARAGVSAERSAAVGEYLQRLHDDLETHIQTEEQVLFPKVLGVQTA